MASSNNNNGRWNERVEGKLDRLDERLDGITQVLVKQEEQLAYHIKRTNLLEEKLEPIEKHVALMNALAKIIIALIGVGGVIAGIFKH